MRKDPNFARTDGIFGATFHNRHHDRFHFIDVDARTVGQSVHVIPFGGLNGVVGQLLVLLGHHLQLSSQIRLTLIHLRSQRLLLIGKSLYLLLNIGLLWLWLLLRGRRLLLLRLLFVRRHQRRRLNESWPRRCSCWRLRGFRPWRPRSGSGR